MKGSRLSAYEILSELGSGGMGTVYLGRVVEAVAGLEPETRVALKLVHPNLLGHPGYFKRFLREARIGQEVRHENVVRTYDCDATLLDGRLQNFLVMEYVEGQTLRELLQELECVPEELCRHIGREVAKGLAAIHAAGAIHRDLKPENVLITEEHVVKVMDLGVAGLQDEAVRLSWAGAFVGSVEYAAPEQFRKADGEPDGRADLHALGVVLYELSTGTHPYRDEDVRKVLHDILETEPRRPGDVNPQLSPFFEEVVRTLVAKSREDRFESATELFRVLEAGERSAWWKARAKALRVETQRPLRRVRIPRETALYGRDDDLARLRALYDTARAGDGQVLLIEGEAGIGKTRLVDEFVADLRRDGEDVNFLFGSYPPGGAATAAGAFSTAYREQFGEVGLEETLGEYLTGTPLLIPAFAALLCGDARPSHAEPLTQDSLQTMFVHATTALAAERTTILLIDDLHFAPQGGLALFASLALAVPGHRVLMIGTGRPGPPTDWAAGLQRSHVARMSLSRLGPKDLAQLLEDAFGSGRLARELGHQIAVKSDGNPFFAFEIIRDLREGHLITQTAEGTWISTQEIRDIRVPSTVADLIHARLRDLSEVQRELLDVASCCGVVFDPDLVAEVVGLKPIPALRAFGQVENAYRLVRSVGRDFAFDHHQVQEALYGGQPMRLRERYHAAIAAALEAREGAAERDPLELDGAVAVMLARQYLDGARGGEALRYLDAALTHLEAGYLNDEAIALVDRALAVEGLVTGPERVGLLLRKAARHDLLGQADAQRAVYEEALPLAEADGDEKLRARVRLSFGLFLVRTQSGGAGMGELHAALELARAAGDRRGEARALGNLALAHRSLHQWDESVAHNERALALYRELDDLKGEAACLGNLGTLYNDRGLMSQARASLERSLEIFRELGNRQHEIIATHNLGCAYHYLGRFRQAQACFERCVAASREIGFRAGEEVPTDGLFNLRAAVGRVAQARAHFEQRLVEHRRTGRRRDEASALADLAETERVAGDPTAAERRYRQAVAMLREVDVPRRLAESLADWGGLLAGSGRYAEAAPVLDEALDVARRWKHPASEVRAACYRTLLPGGDAALAQRTLLEQEEHVDLETAIQGRFLLWRATAERSHLEAARRLLDELVGHAAEADRASLLEGVALHREIVEAWEAQDSDRARRDAGERPGPRTPSEPGAVGRIPAPSPDPPGTGRAAEGDTGRVRGSE